ncbi:MAG: LacI family DNA-binding transcriptional regulator [Christensenellales bacterium]|jgi:DNA-binding LacI/PurR family transcriptional regulator
MKITIRTIAELAGVSPSTVSLVLNGKGNVSGAKRRKIENLIAQTGYRPSISSRRLSSKRSFNICVAPNANASPFTDLFFLSLTRGVHKEAIEHGYNVVLSDFSEGLPNTILNDDADGIIFFQDLEQQEFEQMRDMRVPFVVADSHVYAAPYATVGMDNELISKRAVSYLLDMRHRDIAFLGPIDRPNLFNSCLQGYHSAFRERGLLPPSDRIIRSVNAQEHASEAVTAYMETHTAPTALFCSGDRFAVGALLRFQEMGLRIPDDISIISIDDTLLCQYVRPKLTAMHIDAERIGICAMQLLEKLIAGCPVENIILPETSMSVRDSVREL